MTPPDPLVTESLSLTEGLLQRLATEVRQTLHEVLGTMELVSERPLAPRQTGQLAHCGENLHRLLRIANDVSELVDYRSTGERLCSFSFSELLEEFCGLLRSLAAKKGLELRWTVDRHVPGLLLGYRRAIEGVLYRLVDNSIQFTPQGSISLAVHVRKLDRQFGEVAIEVSDTGPGIPPETLADLRNSTSESRTVAGLGLRLARKQMASIGGHLEVVSSDPRGATLAMVIPVTIPVKDPASEPTLFDHSDSVLLRLLVVEDSDDSFAVFESFVKDEGHAITRAINGEEAVNMVKTGNFDMVIMDVQMPVMDGYTSTRAIRDWETKEGRVRRPILLLSADDPGRQKRIGSAAGCSGYLTKPTSKRELICALRSYSTVPAFPQSKDVDIHI